MFGGTSEPPYMPYALLVLSLPSSTRAQQESESLKRRKEREKMMKKKNFTTYYFHNLQVPLLEFSKKYILLLFF